MAFGDQPVSRITLVLAPPEQPRAQLAPPPRTSERTLAVEPDLRPGQLRQDVGVDARSFDGQPREDRRHGARREIYVVAEHLANPLRRAWCERDLHRGALLRRRFAAAVDLRCLIF